MIIDPPGCLRVHPLPDPRTLQLQNSQRPSSKETNLTITHRRILVRPPCLRNSRKKISFVYDPRDDS